MNYNRLVYRNANMQDLSGIMKIEHSAFSNLICEEEKVFAERIDIFPEGFMVMEIAGKVTGYICSELWTKPKVITSKLFALGHSIEKQHNPNGNELYISSMGILSEHHGKGLGKALFEEFLKRIENELKYIESIILVVSENWSNAKKIYTANGFKEINILEKFFSHKKNELHFENGIVMRKELLQNF